MVLKVPPGVGMYRRGEIPEPPYTKALIGMNNHTGVLIKLLKESVMSVFLYVSLMVVVVVFFVILQPLVTCRAYVWATENKAKAFGAFVLCMICHVLTVWLTPGWLLGVLFVMQYASQVFIFNKERARIGKEWEFFINIKDSK